MPDKNNLPGARNMMVWKCIIIFLPLRAVIRQPLNRAGRTMFQAISAMQAVFRLNLVD